MVERNRGPESARTRAAKPYALLGAAKEAHQAGQVDVAERLYAQVVRTVPADASEAYRCLGILCVQTDRLPQAIEHLTAALRLAPGDAALLNDLGTLYQRANRPEDAIAAYRHAVARSPDFGQAHFHLGTELFRQGMLAESIESYRRAIALAPRAIDTHLNLGVALQHWGKHADAEAAFRSALAIDPLSAAAHFNLGISLAAQEHGDAAVAAYRAAIGLEPNAAPVHVNLGMTLEKQGKLDEAMACYQRAIAIDPSLAVAYHNLGCALRGQGRFEEAIAGHRRGLEIDPTSAVANVDLGAALEEHGQLDEAIASYRRAIELEPDLALAHRALAVALRARDLEAACASFRRHAALVFGTKRPAANSATPIAPHRTKHDREQLEYLVEHRIVPNPEALRAAEARTREPPERFHDRFSTLFHIEGGERIEPPAVTSRDRHDSLEIETRWERSDPKIVVIDDLLSPEALDGLKRFCWGSTIWRSEYRDGYLGAMPEGGFAVPLLVQVSNELVATFPRIFRDHPLLQWWAFKYDSALSGIGVHADFAAVNVNFWITPDDANLDPEHGGLVIWDKPAPLDWTFEKYNNVDASEIREFLARSDARAVTVPYRANRAVIFDSDLFHATDRISFKEGYLNRRINITLLYGLREHGTEMVDAAKRG
jgi:tetratricopeptide (TPR) repeat protein